MKWRRFGSSGAMSPGHLKCSVISLHTAAPSEMVGVKAVSSEVEEIDRNCIELSFARKETYEVFKAAM